MGDGIRLADTPSNGIGFCEEPSEVAGEFLADDAAFRSRVELVSRCVPGFELPLNGD